MKTELQALCAAPAGTLPDGKRSAIAKSPLDGSVAIGFDGIAQDVQVDTRHHGFPAMALHHFPHENYAWLRHHFGAISRLERRGSMGENISTTGIGEHDVAIGDRFRMGTALIEVSQPRQPCATIEHHLQEKGVVAKLVAAARSGWFYRVLKPGKARMGDWLERVERGTPRWTVARAFLAVYGKARAPEQELQELAQLPRISDRFVRDIDKRLAR